MCLRKTLVVALLIVLAAFSEPVIAELVVTEDGWHSWQTDEAAAVTEACCYTWQRGKRSQTGCNLDGRHMSFSSNGDCDSVIGPVQIYVLMRGGKPEKIRVLSSECPVETTAAIADHGVVPARHNVEWFRQVIEDKTLDHDVREEALFGLVQSESSIAFDYLDRLLSRR